MAAFLCVFTLHLLFGLISPSLLQMISADLRSVNPGENITLLCNITQCSEISWYQMNTADVRQIISARQRKIDKHFYVDYNEDKSHFNVTESNSSVSLVIIGVRETDLGFYYCGGRNKTHTEFGKHIRLEFTDSSKNETLLEGGTCWINTILICACSVSVLINICMGAFCCSGPGKLILSGSSCNHTTDFTEKDETINYASVQYKRRSRAAAKKNPTSVSDSVTYATVNSQPQRH